MTYVGAGVGVVVVVVLIGCVGRALTEKQRKLKRGKRINAENAAKRRRMPEKAGERRRTPRAMHKGCIT